MGYLSLPLQRAEHPTLQASQTLLHFSMNQGKLEVVKQEMASVNVDILGISKPKWTGMVNLTEMTIISTTVGKKPLEEME